MLTSSETRIKELEQKVDEFTENYKKLENAFQERKAEKDSLSPDLQALLQENARLRRSSENSPATASPLPTASTGPSAPVPSVSEAVETLSEQRSGLEEEHSPGWKGKGKII